jgi:hypothetical protein
VNRVRLVAKEDEYGDVFWFLGEKAVVCGSLGHLGGLPRRPRAGLAVDLELRVSPFDGAKRVSIDWWGNWTVGRRTEYGLTAATNALKHLNLVGRDFFVRVVRRVRSRAPQGETTP